MLKRRGRSGPIPVVVELHQTQHVVGERLGGVQLDRLEGRCAGLAVGFLGGYPSARDLIDASERQAGVGLRVVGIDADGVLEVRDGRRQGLLVPRLDARSSP